jgi:hypothetical protein
VFIEGERHLGVDPRHKRKAAPNKTAERLQEEEWMVPGLKLPA